MTTQKILECVSVCVCVCEQNHPSRVVPSSTTKETLFVKIFVRSWRGCSHPFAAAAAAATAFVVRGAPQQLPIHPKGPIQQFQTYHFRFYLFLITTIVREICREVKFAVWVTLTHSQSMNIPMVFAVGSGRRLDVGKKKKDKKKSAHK
jgi:hypothetical protein